MRIRPTFPNGARFAWSSIRRHLFGILAALPLLGSSLSTPGQELSGKDIVEQVEKRLWGKTMQGEYEMRITTPRWERRLELRVWMDRPTRSFIRIEAPAKEAGIGSLRIGAEMWNYLPSIERIVKIPPTMMLQPWMGSDFTNDDLVKESSMIDDYTHRVSGVATIEGVEAYLVELTPKPESAVVWGKVLYAVRKHDLMPLRTQYFDERGELVRTLTFREVKAFGARAVPTLWEMRPSAKPGNVTTILFKSPVWDRPIDPEVFTQRNLQSK